jgi:hypothetical protein
MPFSNDILAGTALVRTSIKSPNYVAGTSGWTINRDGTAEFSDLTARGSVSAAGTFPDGRVVLDGQGIHIYNALSVKTGDWLTRDPNSGSIDAGSYVASNRFGVPGFTPSSDNYSFLIDVDQTVSPHTIAFFFDSGVSADFHDADGVRVALTNASKAILDKSNIITGHANSNAVMTLAGAVAVADVPGATVSVTTANANAVAIVTGTYQVDCTVAGTGTTTVQLDIDGTAQTEVGQYTAPNLAMGSNTLSQTWRKTLAAAGAHTLKLRALKGGTGTHRIINPSSGITVVIFDIP